MARERFGGCPGDGRAVWDEAAKHFGERELAALVLWIATTNFFNRINVTTRQPAPQSWE